MLVFLKRALIAQASALAARAAIPLVGAGARKVSHYRKKFDLSKASSFSVPTSSFMLNSEDGVRLHGSRLDGEGDWAWLVVHGLYAHHRAPGFAEVAESLTRFGPVWAIDLRGHGASGGLCTLGNLEALDVAEAMRMIRAETSKPIAGVGFSMGGAAVLRAAGLFEPLDAVIAVSSPARWHGKRRWAAHRIALTWKVPNAHHLVRAITGVRLDPVWKDCESPAEVAAKVSPSPVLIVHGTNDDFFPMEEADDLFDSALDPKDLWIVPGGGHAEGLFMRPGDPPERSRIDEFTDEVWERLEALL